MAGLLDNVGGIGGLMKLASDPSHMGLVIAKSMPGCTHTLGRQRLYGEIAGNAAILAMNAHRMIQAALLAKRDILPEEVALLDRTEREMLQLVFILNKFPRTIQGMTIDDLKKAYCISTGDDRGTEETRHVDGKGPRPENAGTA